MIPVLLLTLAAPPDATRFPPADRSIRSVTDADLAAVPNPDRLEVVVLRGPTGYGNDRATDAGIAHLARCRNLRVLKAGALGLTDRCLETVGTLTNLEELALDGNALTGDGLKHLAGLTKLRRLHLHFNPIRPEAVAALEPLAGLTHLSLSVPVDDALLERCGKLPNLQRLDLPDDTPVVTDRGLTHLIKLGHLTNLTLKHTRGVTDAGLAELARLSRLEDLKLDDVQGVTPRGLDRLGDLTGLKRLEIVHIHMDDVAAKRLTPLVKLESLLLWSVADQLDLDAVAEFTELRAFRTNLPVPASAVRALTRLPHLESVAEELTEITDADVAAFAERGRLKHLVLDSDRVTAASLPTLAKLTKLQSLFVTDRVKVTPAEWATLGRTALPRCQIGLYRAPSTVYHKPSPSPD